jgi:hypothetical protein
MRASRSAIASFAIGALGTVVDIRGSWLIVMYDGSDERVVTAPTCNALYDGGEFSDEIKLAIVRGKIVEAAKVSAY